MIVEYSKSILSYISAIRNYYGLEYYYEPNNRLKELLDTKKPNKIFLILIDAMGANLINRKLSKDSFLKMHLLDTCTSVFPPTTTAATTSIQNGKTPAENGWLGWSQYIKELDDIIIPFLSKSFYGDKKYEDGYFDRYCPITTTDQELNEKGIKATSVYPAFKKDGCKNLEAMCKRLIDYSNNSDYQYIYAYWDKYDSMMHKNGPDASVCDKYLLKINSLLENLANNISDDTMLIITADHGQIEAKREYDLVKSKFVKYFIRKPSLEFRAASLFIYEDMKKEFEEEFNKEFKDDYLLLSYDEVIENKIFGDRDIHPYFKDFVGDYLAIAKGHTSLRYGELGIKGDHAGMSEDELNIPIITYMK